MFSVEDDFDGRTSKAACCATTTTTITKPLMSCGKATCGGDDGDKSSIDSNLSISVSTEMDALIAKELYDLSLNERQLVLEEIHGIQHEIEEDPVFVNTCISQLDDEINKFHPSKRAAYDLAYKLHPKRVTDSRFRVMFLRSECFDVSKTAKRIINHFEYKLELFGQEKIAEKITIDDLDADDHDALRTCSVRFLDQKDRAGRAVLLCSHKTLKYKSVYNQIRHEWYQFMAALEDESVQKLGIVSIIFSDVGSMMPAVAAKGYMLKNGVPIRMKSIHFCYNDTRLRGFLSVLLKIIGKEGRIRFRPHYGALVECRYALMAYGIPVDEIPHSFNDEMYRAKFLAKIESKRYEEWVQLLQDNQYEFCESEPTTKMVQEGNNESIDKGVVVVVDDDIEKDNHKTSSKIVLPKHADVLLGNGKYQRQHPGNLHMVDIVSKRYHEYEAASKFEKICISFDIMNTVKARTGRFLKKIKINGAEEWLEVDDRVAHDTISHRFRNLNRRTSKKSETSKERQNKRSKKLNSI